MQHPLQIAMATVKNPVIEDIIKNVKVRLSIIFGLKISKTIALDVL